MRFSPALYLDLYPDLDPGATGTAELDAHTAILTLCVFLFISFPFGVATASTIRVGNLLGAGRPWQARLAGESPSGSCRALGRENLKAFVARLAISPPFNSVSNSVLYSPCKVSSNSSCVPVPQIYFMAMSTGFYAVRFQ